MDVIDQQDSVHFAIRKVQYNNQVFDIKLDLHIHELLKECRFSVRKTKNETYFTVYVYHNKRTRTLAHVVLGLIEIPQGMVVDHKDRSSFNNTRDNVHLVNYGQNAQNKKKLSNCSSKFIGVHWKANIEKWHVDARFEGKTYDLGCYAKNDELLAAKSYDRFVIYKYQSLYVNTNKVLSRKEIQEALISEPDVKIQKASIWGKGISQLSNGTFQCTWQDDGRRHSEKFTFLEDAIDHRKQQLTQIQYRKATQLQNKEITRNSNGIAIIRTNLTKGEQREFKVDDNIFFELIKHNWSYIKRSENAQSKIFSQKPTTLGAYVLQLNHVSKTTNNDSVDHINHDHFDCRF